MEFTELIDLASDRLGGTVLAANDEFFAPKENLLRPGKPEWKEGAYTERGKWMDGWETRRRRDVGFDWALIRLGIAGIVRGVIVDTSFFMGNFPEQCALEGCEVSGTPAPAKLLDASTQWLAILQPSPLRGNSENGFAVTSPRRFTHLRLTIVPDGGVARFRAYGDPAPDLTRFALAGGEIDLAAAESGGLVLACSDQFFGHRHNLIMPGRSTHMGDGWETRRRRSSGHDWSIVRLATAGVIHRVEIDTDHFKGNAPESVSLQGCEGVAAAVDELTEPNRKWTDILPRTTVQPHSRHRFEEELVARDPVTHIRLNIFPDGGVARLRVFGTMSGRAP